MCSGGGGCGGGGCGGKKKGTVNLRELVAGCKNDEERAQLKSWLVEEEAGRIGHVRARLGRQHGVSPVAGATRELPQPMVSPQSTGLTELAASPKPSGAYGVTAAQKAAGASGDAAAYGAAGFHESVQQTGSPEPIGLSQPVHGVAEAQKDAGAQGHMLYVVDRPCRQQPFDSKYFRI